MEHFKIDGQLFSQMVQAGAERLKANSKKVDDLNVFPVPDGDTGTNMTLSITSGVNEMLKKTTSHIGEAAQALSKGLLMGARGNSGVILSQLFRGFGKAVTDFSEIDAKQFADALYQGVEAAYKAVMKPVEGTILTVAKEAAKAAVEKARREKNVTAIMSEALKVAKEALAKTPEQLPILKQVGVVDSGGQGLVFVYEGFLSALHGEVTISETPVISSSVDSLGDIAHEDLPAQANMRPEDIVFGYCTEFIIGLNDTYRGVFNEGAFRQSMDKFGDSLLVISDDELVKVHIHTEYPGEVLSFAQQYGHFKKIKIENMREQLVSIHEEVKDRGDNTNAETSAVKQPYALVAVAAGDGLEEIFKSLDVDVVIKGGQTMNPSTEDFVRAIEKVNAERIIILPNNSNIIMAAEQATQIIDTPAVVVPTKTIPQGISALIAFDPTADLEENKSQMTESIASVKSGQVTYSIRDSKFGGVEIKEGDFIGILEKDIVASDANMHTVAEQLIAAMLDEDSSVLTIIYGEGATEESSEQLAEYAKTNYPNVEVEVHYGGQPVYSYIFSVE